MYQLQKPVVRGISDHAAEEKAGSAKLLTLPQATGATPSIRAKALVFNDPRSRQILAQLERIGPTEASVMIIGETGTGKELVARHLHALSERSGPFVAVNCGAFNEGFIEAELFGHEAGAFTGAQQSRPGWFETAQGGTLFLDEIGDMPLSLQVKLLRVLQERQVVRLGSRKSIPVDVRLVAATNVDLERAVLAGHFRRDLFYRLNVAPIRLPDLRDRPDDILPLAAYFIAHYGQRFGAVEAVLSPAAESNLLSYDWPGNIRELENVIHYALIVCQNNQIRPEDLRFTSLRAHRPTALATPPVRSAEPQEALEEAVHRLLESDLTGAYEEIERIVITQAYEFCRRNQVQTAKRLGISRNVLRAQLKRFGLID